MIHIPKKDTQDKPITVDLPQYLGNQYYLQTAFGIISALTDVAKTMQNYDDIRFSTLTEMLLNCIIDTGIRAEYLTEKVQLINNLAPTLSPNEKAAAIHLINIQMFGKWFQYAKRYMTLETKLEIFHTAPDIALPKV